MILHLLRHQEPDIPPGVCYGRLDVASRAIDAAAPRLRTLWPEGLAVHSSPLRRCRLLAESLHGSPCFDARLQEMHFGTWEGRHWDEIGATALDAWAADVADFVPPGGESGWQVQARALDWLGEVLASGVAECVAVTHAGVMRALLAHWLELPASRWLELRFDYATVTTVEVDASGVGRVLRQNA